MTASSAVALLVCVALPATLVYAGVMDVLTLRIRNRLVASLGLLFVPAALLAGLGVVEIGLALLAGALVFGFSFGFFACGWIGGGDAKLAPVAALWFGWGHTLTYFYWVSLFGCAVALALLALRRVGLPERLRDVRFLRRLVGRRRGVPYGVAFGLASLVVMPQSVWSSLV